MGLQIDIKFEISNEATNLYKSFLYTFDIRLQNYGPIRKILYLKLIKKNVLLSF